MLNCDCDRKRPSFTRGLLMGVLIGAAAGILLAPKSGKSTRKELKELAYKKKEDAEVMYSEASRRVNRKIRDIKAIGGKIDKARYEALIADVLDDLQGHNEISSGAAEKLGLQLRDDWDMVRRQITR